MSRVKNKKKKATVDLTVQISNRKVKMNQPCSPLAKHDLLDSRHSRDVTIRKRPNESRNADSSPLAVVRSATMSKPPGVRMMATAIQNPP